MTARRAACGRGLRRPPYWWCKLRAQARLATNLRPSRGPPKDKHLSLLEVISRRRLGGYVGRWHDRHWEADIGAPHRRDQRGGPYQAYEPGPLCSWPIVVSVEMSELIAQAENAVRALAVGPEVGGLEGLARFLLRSEAIASSRIEGLSVSPQQVALAELAQSEELTGRSFSENAQLVANNITVLRSAAYTLAAAPTVDLAGIDALHHALLENPELHGLRTTQNWIGGSDYHPLDAQFVPPPEHYVRELMDDLVVYSSGATHSPILQAALVHAQFETIHPYRDGNGRVGRALIHTVLTRRGLTPSAILPVSLVLLTRDQDYLDGLTAFRFDGTPASAEGRQALDRWLQVFVNATIAAAEQASDFARQLSELREQWVEQLGVRRAEQGTRGRPRAGSTTARLIQRLPEFPLFTIRTVQEVLDVSDVAARAAAEELADAGIVSKRRIGNTTGHFPTEVFELLTIAERRLASTRWDTRESPPNRPVPAVPVDQP